MPEFGFPKFDWKNRKIYKQYNNYHQLLEDKISHKFSCGYLSQANTLLFL